LSDYKGRIVDYRAHLADDRAHIADDIYIYIYIYIGLILRTAKRARFAPQNAKRALYMYIYI